MIPRLNLPNATASPGPHSFQTMPTWSQATNGTCKKSRHPKPGITLPERPTRSSRFLTPVLMPNIPISLVEFYLDTTSFPTTAIHPTILDMELPWREPPLPPGTTALASPALPLVEWFCRSKSWILPGLPLIHASRRELNTPWMAAHG